MVRLVLGVSCYELHVEIAKVLYNGDRLIPLRFTKQGVGDDSILTADRSMYTEFDRAIDSSSQRSGLGSYSMYLYSRQTRDALGENLESLIFAFNYLVF
jgi:hypothetical protein